MGRQEGYKPILRTIATVSNDTDSESLHASGVLSEWTVSRMVKMPMSPGGKVAGRAAIGSVGVRSHAWHRSRPSLSPQRSAAGWLTTLIAVVLAFGLGGIPARAQLFGGGAGGGGPVIVIENARIIPMVGPVIERGTIVMQGGRITAMGAEVEVPRRAMRVNGEGKTVTPGLVDVSSGLGMSLDGPPGSGVLRKATDGFDPFSELAFEAALRNGVTALYVGPRSGNGFAGTGAVVRLAKRDDGGRGVVLNDEFDFVIDMTNGNPIERVEAFEQVRAQFRAALNHRDALDEYEEKLETYTEELKKYIEEYEKKEAENEGKSSSPTQPRPPGRRGPGGGPDGGPGGGPGGPPSGGRPSQQQGGDNKGPEKPAKPEPNRAFDLLLKVLDGEMRVRVRAEKDADLLNALDLSERLGLKFTIEGGSEAWLIADKLAEQGHTVVLGSVMGRASRSSTDQTRINAATLSVLKAAGVPVFVGSGGASSGLGLGTRFVLENAQLALQAAPGTQAADSDAGMQALKLVTIDAARFLGITREAGTLRQGGTADLVLWSGDPSKGGASVEQVYIDGRPAFAARRRGGQAQ